MKWLQITEQLTCATLNISETTVYKIVKVGQTRVISDE